MQKAFSGGGNFMENIQPGGKAYRKVLVQKSTLGDGGK